LILIGVLFLVNLFVELGPWVWAALLAGAGLGAFGVYLAQRSSGRVLLAAYVLWAIAGLIALVSTDVLRDEAVAFYALLGIALPFLVAFVRDRTRWWALIPAYALLAVQGVIGLAESRLVGDDLVTAVFQLPTGQASSHRRHHLIRFSVRDISSAASARLSNPDRSPFATAMSESSTSLSIWT
jgi:hypothetical protein